MPPRDASTPTNWGWATATPDCGIFLVSAPCHLPKCTTADKIDYSLLGKRVVGKKRRAGQAGGQGRRNKSMLAPKNFLGILSPPRNFLWIALAILSGRGSLFHLREKCRPRWNKHLPALAVRHPAHTRCRMPPTRNSCHPDAISGRLLFLIGFRRGNPRAFSDRPGRPGGASDVI